MKALLSLQHNVLISAEA